MPTNTKLKLCRTFETDEEYFNKGNKRYDDFCQSDPTILGVHSILLTLSGAAVAERI